MTVNFTQGKWINRPPQSRVTGKSVEIVTEPGTDFWQRSYYGFRNDNAPAILVESTENFTFSVQTEFTYTTQFDQCGVIIYINSENWFKASIEYENSDFSRLGSVVTNLGYSDWATTDIETVNSMWYRLSRRGPDFLIEFSADGQTYRQMRIFHLHLLGETTADMGQKFPPDPPAKPLNFGLYACSPGRSSFSANFSNFKLEKCIWKPHKGA